MSIPQVSGSILHCVQRHQQGDSSSLFILIYMCVSISRASGSIRGCAERHHRGDNSFLIYFQIYIYQFPELLVPYVAVHKEVSGETVGFLSVFVIYVSVP